MTTSTPTSPLVPLGKIMGTHGVRGLVCVKPFGEEPRHLFALGPLFNANGTQEFVLSPKFIKKDMLVCNIKGVHDCNTALALRGTTLFLPRHLLPEPADDEFYYSDLINLKLVNAMGQKIGHVINVCNYGAGDLLDVFLDSTGQTELIPFSKACVPEINIAQGFVMAILSEDIDEEVAE